MVLPTGKAHISHSELNHWVECSWRHNLKHVKNIDLDVPNTNLAFGSAVHSACEYYLNNKVINLDSAQAKLDEQWELYKDSEDFLKNSKEKFMSIIANIMNDVAVFLDTTFPGWELVKAEEELYENLGGMFEKHEGLSFKGFIDVVLKVPGKKPNTWLYWILDWKSANRPWNLEKIQDENVRRQLIFYKKFWSIKHNIPMKDIRCGFITLVKTSKPGRFCNLITISVGDVTVDRSLKILNNALASIKRGTMIKNRNSCKYCPYKDTEHCKFL